MLLAFILATLVILQATGLTENLSREELRRLIEGSGALGVAIYFILFAVGALLYLPPTIFIGAGILAYGPLWGGLIAFVASMIAMFSSFILVRAVGGQVLVEIERPWVKRALGRLDSRPISTVVVLRTVFWVSPPLTYVLAMSGIRFREFAVASTLGMVLPMIFISLAFGWLFE